MSSKVRGSRRQAASINEEIAQRGYYTADSGERVSIGAQLRSAQAGTVSYTPQDLDDLLGDMPRGALGSDTGRVEVTGEDSLQAAARLYRDGGRHVGVLNFASARNPGGGYLGGARAQEEDLCRSALLYSCLLKASDYYEAHRASDDLRYSHRVIFSPCVPVIRDETGALMAAPYEVSFLTSPAPNAGELRRRSVSADVAGVLTERAVRVLAVAARHGVRDLVLGAWGCGVFRNDPAEVAAAFGAALGSYGAAFDQVVFAIWDRAPVSTNRAVFAARFEADRS